MKILWFSPTPSLYQQGKHHYHGGGWIESLEKNMHNNPNISLGVAFMHPTDHQKVNQNNVVYYPILRKRSRKNPVKALINNWRGKIDGDNIVDKFLEVINDFQPDIIQVFGTENAFALIQPHTKIPVLVHLQGLINPVVNAYFPPNYSKWNIIFSKHFIFENIKGASPFFSQKRFKAQAKREKQIFSQLKYVCGRTAWDKQITHLFNPNIQYFHIDEVLRPEFYLPHHQNATKTVFTILSTLSPTIYKGIDVVLKAAQQLTNLCNVQFEWKIAGVDASTQLLKLIENKEKISHKKVNITLLGKLNAIQLINEMKEADVFVHPSYIDNSPNSVCEAQLMGLPIIACNVGGLSSLITHKENGILVPSNGVYELVHYLQQLYNNPSLRQQLGNKAQEIAKERHQPKKITENLLAAYLTILQK